jgi:hypothetical protein
MFELIGALVVTAAVAIGFYIMRIRPKRDSLRAQVFSFLGSDPSMLAITSKQFSTVDLPNLDLAIRSVAKSWGAKSSQIGYLNSMSFRGSISELLGEDTFDRTKVGPVRYEQIEIAPGKFMDCMTSAIHLLDAPHAKLAAHVYEDNFKGGQKILEIMSSPPEAAASFMEAVRDAIAKQNVYRGQVISLECDRKAVGAQSGTCIRFHRLPEVPRERLILPEETLRMIERNTVGFFDHAETLGRHGRSLKRGILLHGKPGTGKTFTAKWLAHAREGVTVILLSGDQLALIKECCDLARLLAPAIVIMEDVDLIATERDTLKHPALQVTLHQLMNEMDGLSSDAPILFLLTTNRPGEIEAAIAARPGRVDQAIEYPLPDAECRRKLIELYGEGLTLTDVDFEGLVARTEGASPAFIQEMMRKAALIAAEEGERDGQLVVTGEQLHAAIRELLFGGGELTRNLLGFARETG